MFKQSEVHWGFAGWWVLSTKSVKQHAVLKSFWDCGLQIRSYNYVKHSKEVISIFSLFKHHLPLLLLFSLLPYIFSLQRMLASSQGWNEFCYFDHRSEYVFLSPTWVSWCCWNVKKFSDLTQSCFPDGGLNKDLAFVLIGIIQFAVWNSGKLVPKQQREVECDCEC